MRWLLRLLRHEARRLHAGPWWKRAALGLVVLALGLIVLTRPLESLTLLVALVVLSLLVEGFERILVGQHDPRRTAAGLGLVAAAGVLLAWPSITVDALAVIAGVSLIVHGVHELVTGFRLHGAALTGMLMSGLAWSVFGALALIWPDVSLLVVGIAFGLRFVGFGIGVVTRAWRDRGGEPEPAAVASPSVPGRLALAGRAFALVLALALLAATAVVHDERAQPTAAYATTDTLPDGPGRLIKSTPYTHGVPDGARGWLILHTTTDGLDRPRTASAFVMVPRNSSGGPHEVVLWDHGTEGADITCAPTLLPQPLPLAAPIAALKKQLELGRVLIGPDYPGMGTPGDQSYLIGEAEGRSSLDAVRAADQIAGLDLAPTTAVWGHSQGGQAALWTAGLAADYAPEIDLVGVAAAAPATDVRALVASLSDTLIGKVMGSFAIRAYAETYDDVRVDDYIDPRMRLIYDAMSRRCIPAKTTLVSLLTGLAARGPMYRKDPSTGALGDRLDENVPRNMIDVPVFIAQGTDDRLILPRVQDGYVRERCAAGQALMYRTYEGRGHLSVVADDSPFADDLLAWTEDRFAGRPQANIC